MSVVIETTLGDLTVDLFLKERPRACLNFLKLCRIKYYNLCIFHKVERNFIAQTGDPTATGRGGESVFSHLYGEQAKYFDSELKPRLKHERAGTLSMVNNGNNMNGSQFFLTLGEKLAFLDEVHTVFGEVVEGHDVLRRINEAICDATNRPYQDIRITHMVVLHDPYDDPPGLQVPEMSPVPTREQLESGYIGADEEIDDAKGKDAGEIEEKIKESEARARATILEMVGDLPDADVKPPENVLFVCKLNPVTTSEDLEVIFSRFGKIASCEVIKDRKSGDSLQYAFVEFEREEDCENAYFKMDNVLIDDRRIHVDFSQSVSKMNWEKEAKAKLRGLAAKGQKFAIKGAQRKTGGYDMVFDMDNAANPKDKRQSRGRSPNRSYRESTSARYDSGNRSKYSDERFKDKFIEDDHHHSNRKSNYYSISERSKNGNVEMKSHVSRSLHKKVSPRRSQHKSGSSDRSKEKTSKMAHLKKGCFSSSSSSCSPVPTKSVSSSHRKEKKLDESSNFERHKKSPLRCPRKRQDSSSSSSDSTSPIRKSALPQSTVRSRSPERKNYRKKSSRHYSQSPEPFYHNKNSSKHTRLKSRSKSPKVHAKTSSRHKSYNKRESSSPERSSKQEYSNLKSLELGSKYNKEQTLKSSKASKNYSQFSDDSSDTNYKQYKSKEHKSISSQHTSRYKHSHKEHKHRKRSSS